MDNKRKLIISVSIFLISCGFMLYGLVRGEAGIVLNKAVHICLECIGLG